MAGGQPGMSQGKLCLIKGKGDVPIVVTIGVKDESLLNVSRKMVWKMSKLWTNLLANTSCYNPAAGGIFLT